MKGEAKFSLGFMKPCEAWPFDHAGAFGHPGAGGSLGFADPESGIGYAYVTNRMGVSLTGDPEKSHLEMAVYSATPAVAVFSLRNAMWKDLNQRSSEIVSGVCSCSSE